MDGPSVALSKQIGDISRQDREEPSIEADPEHHAPTEEVQRRGGNLSRDGVRNAHDVGHVRHLPTRTRKQAYTLTHRLPFHRDGH